MLGTYRFGCLWCICVQWRGGVGGGVGAQLLCPYPPHSPHIPSDIKANFWQWGSLASQAPFSTQETKHGAASLHCIKQSLNASSCYTLPNETFMKGPLMWFQKHLVISPRAAECTSVDVWMSELPLKSGRVIGRCRYGFTDHFIPLQYRPLLV